MVQLKNVINSHEWKVFCLETEIDLSKKEKNQFKSEWEKTELKLAEKEVHFKDQRVKMFAAEEEARLAEEEAKYLRSELGRKQTLNEDLAGQVAELKEYSGYL